MTKPDKKMDTVVSQLAKEFFNFDTLETRNSDSLDFKETAVWCVKDALEAAYKAGKAAK